MAGFKMTMETELRPCIVKDKEKSQKALFHKFCEYKYHRRAILRGDVSGICSDVFALVEYEDGTMQFVYPASIRFVDEKVKQVFNEGDYENEVA